MPSARKIVPDQRSGAGGALRMRHVPGHQMIGEVGERIAQRRQFPVEHGNDLRRLRRHDQIVEPVVAMHHARRRRPAARGRAATRSAVPWRRSFPFPRRGTASTSARPGARRNSRRGRNRPSRFAPARTCAAARWLSSSRRRPRRVRPDWRPASAAPRTRGRRHSSSRRTACRRRCRRRKRRAARRPGNFAHAAR